MVKYIQSKFYTTATVGTKLILWPLCREVAVVDRFQLHTTYEFIGNQDKISWPLGIDREVGDSRCGVVVVSGGSNTY